MPKINNPGCGCCQPPCVSQCADGSTDEIAEWEWSIADLSNEVYVYIKLKWQTVDPTAPIVDYWVWYRLKLLGYPLPLGQGLAELNGIYIINHNLVTCQKTTAIDTAFVQVEIAATEISFEEDFCPDFDAYSGGFGTIWLAGAIADYYNWGIYFEETPPGAIESQLHFRLRLALNAWSRNMFDVRPAFGGDGLCVSKTYQAQPPWVPDSCTVDETRQTFNNVYTVTPA